MSVTLNTFNSVNNRTYVDSVVNRILLCCFLMIYSLLGTTCINAQAPEPLFPKQDMTDRVELADGFRLLKLAGNDQIPNAFCMTPH